MSLCVSRELLLSLPEGDTLLEGGRRCLGLHDYRDYRKTSFQIALGFPSSLGAWEGRVCWHGQGPAKVHRGRRVVSVRLLCFMLPKKRHSTLISVLKISVKKEK